MAKQPDGRRPSFAERFKDADDAIEVGGSMLSDEQIEDDAARWGDIAMAGVQLARASAGGTVNPLALVDPATVFYRAILNVEEAQTRLLRSIDENVKLLVAEPFRTGRTFLKRAADKVDEPERSRVYLGKAQDKFYEALSLAVDPIDQAAVEMHLAICYFLLGHHDDAGEQIEAAYEKTAVQAIELAERTGNTKVLTKSAKWSLLVTGVYGAAFLAIKKLRRNRRDQSAQVALRELLPFLGCLAALHTATGAEADELPAVELVETSRDEFELVEVPV